MLLLSIMILLPLYTTLLEYMLCHGMMADVTPVVCAGKPLMNVRLWRV